VRRILAGAISALLLLSAQACSREPQTDVIAADGALCDITRRLADGDLQVRCLLGEEDDPHQLQLTPEQTRQLSEARLVLINGYGLTPALKDLPGAVKVAEIAVPESPDLGDEGHGHDHAHGHAHGERDPHVWHDPRQAAAMVQLVSQKLQALAPASRARIEARAEAMQSSLQALHRWNQQQFSTVPKPAILASGHRAFASLTRAYGLQELSVLDASSTSEALRPQALSAVLRTLSEQKVRSLFAEQQPAGRSLQRISQLSGVPIAPRPLRADSAGENLMATLTGNTCLIVDALGGRCDGNSARTLVERWMAIR
jgi:ABC-type Zn uptake system ZnuABC Zn-binding protein ZnuA